MLKRTIWIIIGSWLMLLWAACRPTPAPTPDIPAGKLRIEFTHDVDGKPLVFDTMRYVNAAGNPYLVSNIQYFISDVCLHKNNGDSLLLDKWEDIHYVDSDLPDTWVYALKDDIPDGNYSSVSFTFGINAAKNQTLMFVNPPESDMFWPVYLGGGYHYMKLNGKWRDPNGTIRPFNFHMGIGQIYDSIGNITGFVQNYFNVVLPASDFQIAKGQIANLKLKMNVNEWFKDPHIFDFNQWGGDIMQKQAAMQIARENGHNVFSVKDLNIMVIN